MTYSRLFQPLVILTGAGISAESGIRTFRDNNGLWENHRIEEVATPEAFARNPRLVHEFYNLRRRQLLEPLVLPNAAHVALAELEKAWRGDFLLITQNVDNLHERAGSRKVLHMHGELQKVFCVTCDKRLAWTDDLSSDDVCPGCQTHAGLRPDIVWFGEMPYHMDEISERLMACRLFIAIGTSGKVYPAAGFVNWAARARKIEVNLAESDVSTDFDAHYVGPASEQVPALVRELLGG